MNDDSVAVFKALADDVRLGLVRRIAKSQEPRLTCDIIAECSELSALSQPTISHHIGKLVAAGVLTEVKHAQQKSYLLNTRRLEAVGIDPSKI
ncbi:ArsR family transcriptional regulator [Candidatus Saccharibacteria bacterium]|nr:ArsR family transcriptional regulator [Candidatus Saccharibacteria bacterium]